MLPESIKYESFWLLKNGMKLDETQSLQDSKIISDCLIYFMLEFASEPSQVVLLPLKPKDGYLSSPTFEVLLQMT